ncbi:hypothetical protein AGRA3207_004973 [Actinomadura graeca]|uniref:SGNH/GDSL hydrolase family protein n=1 Tax=Actinomadura graeca TaxID=2750812 RepID=A0ABX8R251_9ACTN|nr:hypothetical protein [Actinomadura graeca]QXJ23772.1 hypothetical protein AGRA3207_004973 [Actinomadura graeca]
MISSSVRRPGASSPVRRRATARSAALTAALTAAALALGSATGAAAAPRPAATAGTMGFIGCSMAENVAQGYVAAGGTRMWGPYGTGGLVVQAWTDPNSPAWQKFDQQAAKFGKPTAVWVQICVFARDGATYDEVKRLIANARAHAAPDATIHITGQPFYETGHTCSLAGADGPKLTDDLARRAAADTTQKAAYSGSFLLKNTEVAADGCHANTAGRQSLGKKALELWT